MNEFKNKVALITGASGAIGKNIAFTLNKSGASVILCGTKIDVLEDIAKDLSGKVEIITENIKNFEKFEKSLLEKKLNVDILVNNAGITKDNLAIRMSLEEWTKVININLTSTFLMSKYSIKKMLKNKSGKIVNITSVVGHTGNVGQANYTASKAGIVAMSKSLAIEYAKKNINVNCISPGFISTAMTDQIDEKFKEGIIAKIPSNRLGKPEDIANAVIFLSSNLSDYINGETLHVNGGMYLG